MIDKRMLRDQLLVTVGQLRNSRYEIAGKPVFVLNLPFLDTLCEVIDALAVPEPEDTPRWVKCSDEMPGLSEELVFRPVYAPARGIDMAAWAPERSGVWIWRDHGYALASEITEWMKMKDRPAEPSPTQSASTREQGQ